MTINEIEKHRKMENKIRTDSLIEANKEIKEGDIFCTSWGYDQTQYDFITVMEISKTGKSAICKMSEVNIDDTTDKVHLGMKPTSGTRGKEFRMKINREYGLALRGSYPFCQGQESAKRLDTFRKCSTNRTYAQTRPEYGH